jgi:hypothetical protein
MRRSFAIHIDDFVRDEVRGIEATAMESDGVECNLGSHWIFSGLAQSPNLTAYTVGPTDRD